MNRSRSVRRRLSRISDMLPSVYEPLGPRLSPDQDRTTYCVLQVFVFWQTHDQPAGKPMGILFQPRHVICRPYRTRSGHQFVGGPEGWRKILCRKAALVLWALFPIVFFTFSKSNPGGRFQAPSQPLWT